jgi:hypothetical protein
LRFLLSAGHSVFVAQVYLFYDFHLPVSLSSSGWGVAYILTKTLGANLLKCLKEVQMALLVAGLKINRSFLYGYGV